MIVIEQGYVPGAIGRIAELSVINMTRFGFGATFEARVARDAAAFCERIGPDAALWRLMEGGRIMGTIAMDAADLGPGKCHLRWFMLDPSVAGRGHGGEMLARACAFADARGSETHLWTIRGLDAAARLYERAGFALAEEWDGDQWGGVVRERRYLRPPLA